jgi:hypothetical protein
MGTVLSEGRERRRRYGNFQSALTDSLLPGFVLAVMVCWVLYHKLDAPARCRLHTDLRHDLIGRRIHGLIGKGFKKNARTKSRKNCRISLDDD